MKLERQTLALLAWGLSRVGGVVGLFAVVVFLFASALDDTSAEAMQRAIEAPIPTHWARRVSGLFRGLRSTAGWWGTTTVSVLIVASIGFALEARMRPRTNAPMGF